MSERTKNQDKLPPQDIEAEKSLLGCLMIDPDAINKVMDFLQARDFYKIGHRKLFQTMMELFDKREPIDILSITSRTKAKNDLEDIGGVSYLTQLVNSVPTATHVINYAKIVQEKRILRDLIQAGQDIESLAYQESEDVDFLVDQAEKKIFSIAQKSLTQVFTPIRDTLEETWQRIDELSKLKGALRGIPTGFTALDNLLAGLQKSDLIILAARPSMGKCISKDTEIIMSNPGHICTVEEVVNQRKSNILTLDGNLKIIPAQACDFIDNGIQTVYAVKTASGREVETTSTHPFLTIDGWKPLSEIMTGDRVGVPRVIPIFGKLHWPDWKIKALAYFIAEGGLTGSCPSFTNGHPSIQSDFIEAISSFSHIKIRTDKKKPQGHCATYTISSSKQKNLADQKKLGRIIKGMVQKHGFAQKNFAKEAGICYASLSAFLNGHTLLLQDNFTAILNLLNPDDAKRQNLLKQYNNLRTQNSVTLFLESLDLMGKPAILKTIPAVVFEFEKRLLALFLNRLFSCDGSFWRSSKQGYYRLSYSSGSRKLIKQVQHLLLRFGVLSKVREKKARINGKVIIAYELESLDAPSLLRFIDEIGMYREEQKLAQAKLILIKRRRGWTQDTVPVEIWKTIAQLKGKLSWADITRKLNMPAGANIHAFKRAPRRETVQKLAVVLEAPALKTISQSDIYWDKVVEIKSIGPKQVYDLTIPETHNFIANDFIIHNSSLAIDIARNVACNYKIPVGIFSLEMSKDQIVDRLISSQANIDLWKLRTGRLSDQGPNNDFERIQQTMGILAEAPIYIDDVSSSNILQMRAMARRLAADQGLGLLIIDYLQLMEARYQTPNLVQQVSENSKALKSLAKELKIPVLVVSQLSRAVEQRIPQIPRLSDLRDSGCLAGDTLITRADTGERIKIEELVGQTDIPVHSLDENWQIKEELVSMVFSSGRKMVYELKTRSGFSIKASANHPFRTLDGWIRLDQLKIKEKIAISREIPELKNPIKGIEDEKVILLGHLIGDGSYLLHESPSYTSPSKKNVAIVKKCVEKIFNIECKVSHDTPSQGQTRIRMSGKQKTVKNETNELNEWLRSIKIFGQRCENKEIPEIIFQLPKSKIRTFIKHLWATDGSIFFAKRTKNYVLKYSSTSKKLIEQLQNLFSRIGIMTNTGTIRKHKESKHWKDEHSLLILDREQELNFLNTIGIFGRETEVKEAITYLKNRKTKPKIDVIPREIWRIIDDERKKINISWRALAKKCALSIGGLAAFGKNKTNLSREKLKKISDILNLPSDNIINMLINAHVFWDSIISIKEIGEAEVFDATIPETHNFLANSIIVHNSIEQDADVVMFIYKEDRYKQNSDRPGVADIIVAKHRNGPVGKVELFFDETRASFRNIAKGYTESY